MCFFTSCSKDETAKDSTETIEATLVLPEEIDGWTGTRSVVVEDGTKIQFWWAPNESIGVYGTRLTNKKFTSTNKYKDAATTYFSGATLFSSPKYAYYPYSADNNSNPQTGVKGYVANVQDYSTTTMNLHYDYKVGKYASWSWSGSKFTFENLLTYMRPKINATGTALEGDRLKQFTMEVTTADGQPRQMSGEFTFDITGDATTAIQSWSAPEEGANKLTLNFADTPLLSSGTTINGYITAAPLMQYGDVMKMTITTDKHIATLTRTSKATFATNKLIDYALTLSNFSDLVIEEIPADIPEQPEVTEIDLTLKSFKFEVAKNPGKILNKKLTWNSSQHKTVASTVTEEVAQIDEQSKKITLFIPYLNSRKLVPTIEVAEGAVVMTDKGEEVDGVNAVDFTGVKQIGVVNPTNGDAVVYDIELTNTGLPVVVVNQETGTTSNEATADYQKASAAWYAATGAKWVPKEDEWPTPNVDTDNFMIYNADGTSALVDKDGAIVEVPVASAARVRGNVTQQMPKKPFAIKLDKKHGVLGMPAHKRWVLLANWKDRTLMRNEVAFGLAKVFKQTLGDGMAWNPSGQHVELVYNGVHVGNYYLCEQIKIDNGRLNISDPYDAEKNADTSNPMAFGYLMENDDSAASEEDPFFFTKTYIPFIFKDDVDAGGVLKNYVQNEAREIDENLYNSKWDAAFAKMELNSFVDFLLVQELMMNSEAAAPKSCYMYIDNGIFHAGPIWDFDWNTLPTTARFERSYSYTKSILTDASTKHTSSYPTSGNEDDAPYVWYGRLIKNSSFKALVTERWDKVKGALKTYADTEIPAIKAKIAASEAVNWGIWSLDKYEDNSNHRGTLYGLGGSWPQAWATRGYCGDEGKSFNDAVDMLQTNLKNRIDGLDGVY